MRLVKHTFVSLSILGVITATGVAYAGAGHDDGDHHGSQKATTSHSDSMGDMSGTSDMFLVKKQIDGYDVSFHVMQAKPGMEHGGSHNLMVKVEQGGKTLTNVVINSKVVYPDKEAKSKPLMKMGDWYMNGYDLSETGEHQLMILFKTSDGKKHKGGVYYPAG